MQAGLFCQVLANPACCPAFNPHLLWAPVCGNGSWRVCGVVIPNAGGAHGGGYSPLSSEGASTVDSTQVTSFPLRVEEGGDRNTHLHGSRQAKAVRFFPNDCPLLRLASVSQHQRGKREAVYFEGIFTSWVRDRIGSRLLDALVWKQPLKYFSPYLIELD